MSFFERILMRYWAMIKKMDEKRLALQSFPEKVKVISDIPYIEGADTPNLLDIYLPEGYSAPLPVIFMVHGGGWLYGNKELNKIYAMNLALRGFALVNINYHLAQESRFPTQLKDIFAALNWVHAHGAEYGLDTGNLFITGDSAGAHLSSIVMALQNNPEASAKLGLSTAQKIKAGGMICGLYDFEAFGGLSFMTLKYASVLIGSKYKKSEYKDTLSFMKVFNGKCAPMYLMTSKEDILYSQNIKMAEFARAHNIPHQFRLWEKGGKHKLIHVFNVTYPLYEESVITNDEMCAFFRNQM